MKLAILQMSDTPQIESTAVMLEHAGYKVKACSDALIKELKRIGCDTVLSVDRMVSMGYDRPRKDLEYAEVKEMDNCDLFVEIKIRNVEHIWNRWPRLKGKTVYWRVNGAQPEICPKGGNEVELICPIITACLWYGAPRYYQDETTKVTQPQSNLEHLKSTPVTIEQLKETYNSLKLGMNGMAYTFWPPYPRSEEYDRIDRASLTKFSSPYCVCHYVRNWGFGEIIDRCVTSDVKMYGTNSPNGMIQHHQVPGIASTAKALVHLKSVDCPGWALYEAILAGCPVITSRLLNSRMLAYGLLEHNVTCLEFGVPASLEYGRGPTEFDQCYQDIVEALKQLEDPAENYRIGQAGRKQLNQLMWNAERDGNDFLQFMQRWFG